VQSQAISHALGARWAVSRCVPTLLHCDPQAFKNTTLLLSCGCWAAALEILRWTVELAGAGAGAGARAGAMRQHLQCASVAVGPEAGPFSSGPAPTFVSSLSTPAAPTSIHSVREQAKSAVTRTSAV